MRSTFKSRRATEVSALQFENVERENSNFDRELTCCQHSFQ